ncbi:MAG TPA: hypothetical protein VN733_08135 [Solirubrobacterales bacterium]|nr:hypothetical protein [Solirubrobacterales bacterium]
MEGGQTPRIAPGSRRQLGPVNAAIAWVLGRATGGEPPHTLKTLRVQPEAPAGRLG